MLAGVCLVKNSNGVPCSSEVGSTALALSLFAVLRSWHVDIYIEFCVLNTITLLVNVVFVALYSVYVLCAMSW